MVKKVKKAKVVFKQEEESEEEVIPKNKAEKTLKFTAAIPDEDNDDYGDEAGDGGSYGSQDFDEENNNSDGDEDDFSEGGASMFSDECGVDVQLDEEETKPLTPAQKEERQKQKRIEKLEKRIKLLQKKKDKAGPKKREKYEREASEIKNKHKRQEVVIRRKMEANANAKLKKLQTRKLREELGEEAVPKGKNQTIESMRVHDETMMDDQEDSDIQGEQDIDEFSKYFKRETTPRILMTTNRRPRGKIFDFMKELKITIPNLEYYPRQNFRIKEIIEWAKEENFTDIIVFQEKWGNPHSMILSHLPDGPTATFRVSSVMLNEDIPNHGANNGMMVAPELILNNFDTMLGSRMGRMIASLFPQDPQLEKRRVITWHNQRDFIFFRHHRYQFNDDGTRAALQEVGPRFTLKLHKLQLGTLDSQFGEYEFLYKPKDGVNRKKFFL